jgi:hypothetical protein
VKSNLLRPTGRHARVSGPSSRAQRGILTQLPSLAHGRVVPASAAAATPSAAAAAAAASRAGAQGVVVDRTPVHPRLHGSRRLPWLCRSRQALAAAVSVLLPPLQACRSGGTCCSAAAGRRCCCSRPRHRRFLRPPQALRAVGGPQRARAPAPSAGPARRVLHCHNGPRSATLRARAAAAAAAAVAAAALPHSLIRAARRHALDLKRHAALCQQAARYVEALQRPRKAALGLAAALPQVVHLAAGARSQRFAGHPQANPRETAHAPAGGSPRGLAAARPRCDIAGRLAGHP